MRYIDIVRIYIITSKQKNRGVDEVKQEAAHKEVSKVREDKAR